MLKLSVRGVSAPFLRVYGEISRRMCRVRNVDYGKSRGLCSVLATSHLWAGVCKGTVRARGTY